MEYFWFHHNAQSLIPLLYIMLRTSGKLIRFANSVQNY